MNRYHITASALSLLLCPAAVAGPVLQLNPLSGNISGSPGATVGWGFTLTNTTDYLVVTSASLGPSTPIGAFTDFIGQFNFIVVGLPPESISVSQTFDATLHTGVGSFAISPSALPGQAAGGVITLSYDKFSRSPNDPNFNPDTDTLATDQFLRDEATVTVVPEPASWLLVGAGLAASYASRICRSAANGT